MRYAPSHEWALLEKDIATIGISAFAQEELGEIVHVELPKIGTLLKAGEEAAVLESTKAASDIYSPLTGEVIEVNPSFSQEKKQDWLFKLKVSASHEYALLMDEETYNHSLAHGSGCGC